MNFTRVFLVYFPKIPGISNFKKQAKLYVYDCSVNFQEFLLKVSYRGEFTSLPALLKSQLSFLNKI